MKYTIKITDDEVYYIIVEVDLQKEIFKIIDKKYSNEYLETIFGDKEYSDFKRWLINRTGSKKTIDEIIELIDINHLETFTDTFKLFILEEE